MNRRRRGREEERGRERKRERAREKHLICALDGFICVLLALSVVALPLEFAKNLFCSVVPVFTRACQSKSSCVCDYTCMCACMHAFKRACACSNVQVLLVSVFLRVGGVCSWHLLARVLQAGGGLALPLSSNSDQIGFNWRGLQVDDIIHGVDHGPHLIGRHDLDSGCRV